MQKCCTKAHDTGFRKGIKIASIISGKKLHVSDGMEK